MALLDPSQRFAAAGLFALSVRQSLRDKRLGFAHSSKPQEPREALHHGVDINGSQGQLGSQRKDDGQFDLCEDASWKQAVGLCRNVCRYLQLHEAQQDALLSITEDPDLEEHAASFKEMLIRPMAAEGGGGRSELEQLAERVRRIVREEGEKAEAKRRAERERAERLRAAEEREGKEGRGRGEECVEGCKGDNGNEARAETEAEGLSKVEASGAGASRGGEGAVAPVAPAAVNPAADAGGGLSGEVEALAVSSTAESGERMEQGALEAGSAWARKGEARPVSPVVVDISVAHGIPTVHQGVTTSSATPQVATRTCAGPPWSTEEASSASLVALAALYDLIYGCIVDLREELPPAEGKGGAMPPLALIKPSEGYDARARVGLRLVSAWLGVSWMAFAAVEMLAARALYEAALAAAARGQEEAGSEVAGGAQGAAAKASSWSKWKRGAIIGAAAVGTGAALAVTGGLAAPALAAGLAMVGAAVPVAGGVLTGAAAVAGSSMGSVAVVGAFGAAGVGLGGTKMARRSSEVKEFRFVPLNADVRAEVAELIEEGDEPEAGNSAGVTSDEAPAPDCGNGKGGAVDATEKGEAKKGSKWGGGWGWSQRKGQQGGADVARGEASQASAAAEGTEAPGEPVRAGAGAAAAAAGGGGAAAAAGGAAAGGAVGSRVESAAAESTSSVLKPGTVPSRTTQDALAHVDKTRPQVEDPEREPNAKEGVEGPGESKASGEGEGQETSKGEGGGGIGSNEGGETIEGSDERAGQGDREEGRLAVTIVLSGFVTDVDGYARPWSCLPFDSQHFALVWDPKRLIPLSHSIAEMAQSKLAAEVATEGAVHVALHAVVGLVALPVALMQMTSMIDSKWAVACQRSEKAGILLAEEILARTHGARPVTLLGFSLGSLVIFSCLCHLAKTADSEESKAAAAQEATAAAAAAPLSRSSTSRSSSFFRTKSVTTASATADTPSVYQSALGLIENVVVMGSPLPARDKRWEAARKVVNGRLVNGYSRSDFVLGVLHRASFMTSGVSGVQPVDAPGVENVDISSLVTLHQDYATVMPDILEAINLESYHVVPCTSGEKDSNGGAVLAGEQGVVILAS